MILTEGQIKAQIHAIRKKANRSSAAFALRSDGPWNGPQRLTIDGLSHRVAFCRSDLELRELLLAASVENEPLVALCPFTSESVGEDVLARLAKHRVHPPEAKEILSSLFQAVSVDIRIFSNSALPNALIEQAPSDGYPPVAGGVLDLQTAWLEIMGRFLGSRETASSIGMLLEASLDSGIRNRLDKMPLDLRRSYFAWAAQNIDRSAGWIMHLVDASKTADLIPMGLLLGLALDPALDGNASVVAARVRLESWFAGQTIDATTAHSWADAAASVIQSLYQRRSNTGSLLSGVLSRFDGLLEEFKIGEFAAKSDHSPSGFEQRVRFFAQTLARFSRPGAAANYDARLIAAIASMQEHMLAKEHGPRIERCRMAARLACWISGGAKICGGASFDEMVEGYMRLGGFVDWARMIVQEGDSDPQLNKAYDAVITRAEEIAGTFEADFATKLADWTTHGATGGSTFVPIELALDRLVGPLAAKAPVLLLLMDGMSVAVYRELLSDIIQRGNWLECQPSEGFIPSALLATVPSITEISRRALFRGKLHPETTPTEQSAFSSNERLFSQSGGQSRPVLFLKGNLQSSGEAGLATDVKTALANKKCRVVAMVLNAVDDHLSGSDQIVPRWDLDFVRPLRELLQLAAESGRTIVLTSDHGHVLEHKTTLKTGMTVGGDRYRADGGAPLAGEIRVTGQRIQQAIGRSDVTVAWSRDIRYAGKKRGYHGGINPQEVVIPFAILRHLNSSVPDKWADVSPSPFLPDWWHLTVGQPTGAAAALEVERTAKATAGMELFAHAAAKAPSNSWIELLLDGELYRDQCKQAVRGAPDRQQVALFLEALSSRGGKLPYEAMAERLGIALLRLNGFVSNLAKVLNVDGYEVVSSDAASEMIVLDIALLKKQFAVSD